MLFEEIVFGPIKSRRLGVSLGVNVLPTEKKYIRVELLLARYATQSVLAFSPLIEIPQGPKYVDEWQPGKEFDFSQNPFSRNLP